MDANETKIYLAILLAAIILGTILVFFISTIVRHQKKSSQLYKQQLQEEIITLEKERKRVASDLHDDLGPFLSSIKLQINLLNTKDVEDVAAIKDISLQINGIVDKIRETSNNLMPNVLIRKGLIVAIEEFSKRINNSNALNISTFLAKDFTIPVEKEIHVFRIVQETIHNTIKHASATILGINMEKKENNLHLKMEDNGKGFDYNIMSKESIGFGLKNIASRVDILKGDLYIDTKPGAGVTYTIIIPLEAI